MSRETRRHERAANGADESSLRYGTMKEFSEALARRVREKGMAIRSHQWNHHPGKAKK